MRQVVLDALAAGKHVICEKPLAHTLASADRIIEAARELPGRLSVVYQFRYLPEVRGALWLRDHGALGPLLSGRFYRFARFHRPGKPARAVVGPMGRAGWGRGDDAADPRARPDVPAVRSARAGVWAVVDTLKEAIESEDACAAVVRFEERARCAAASRRCPRTARPPGSTSFGTRLGPLPVGVRVPGPRPPRRLAPRGARGRARTTRRKRGPAPTSRIWPPCSTRSWRRRPLPSGPEQARLSLELATGDLRLVADRRAVTLPIGPEQPLYAGVDAARVRGSPRASPREADRWPLSRAWRSTAAPGRSRLPYRERWRRVRAARRRRIARYARRDVNTLTKGEGPIAEFEQRSRA